MTDHIAHMSPVSRGINRDLWGHTADYIGGPLDGQRTPVGWHGLRRDENGSPIRVVKEMPPHYVLYRANGVSCWYYVHTALVKESD